MSNNTMPTVGRFKLNRFGVYLRDKAGNLILESGDVVQDGQVVGVPLMFADSAIANAGNPSMTTNVLTDEQLRAIRVEAYADAVLDPMGTGRSVLVNREEAFQRQQQQAQSVEVARAMRNASLSSSWSKKSDSPHFWW